MRRPAVILVAGLLALGPAGCGSDGSGPGTATLTGDLTVLAASSLTESFATIGRQFEAAHPGVRVTFGFGGSSALVSQITSGAPADVFAPASTRDMDAVVAAGAAADPRVFASNVMEIAVPPSNPGNVTGLGSLAGSSVKTALCQPQVPCGSTAQQVLANAGMSVRPVTLEPDVRSVLGKVRLGEVDAGLVYRTDVLAAGAEVTGVEIPAEVNASTDYPIAALSRSDNAAAAAAFVEHVLSAQAAAVLTTAGFGRP